MHYLSTLTISKMCDVMQKKKKNVINTIIISARLYLKKKNNTHV